MKKRHVFLIAVSLCLFVAGNAFAVPTWLPSDAILASDYNVITGGIYSFDKNTFEWEKGDADWSHQLIVNNVSGDYRLKLKVDEDSDGQFDDGLYRSNIETTYFKAYQHKVTGDYIWKIEDNGGGNPTDWDYNDLYAKASSSAVPIPAAVWLFGSGLLGLVGIRKKVYKK